MLLLSLIVSCARYSPIYWGWGEWSSPEAAGMENDSIAVLDWSNLPGVITSIDGNKAGAGYIKAKLLPGRHVLEFAYYTAQFGHHPKGMIEVDLNAGHFYEFGLKLCFWCKPRRYAVWFYDNTAGEVVWGRLPDWPSWFL